MRYKLDLDDDSSDFEGWAFVHFHSPTPGYLLADSLNGLYDYHLARIDDMPLDEAQWPLYRHEDNDMVIFLVEHPTAASSPWEKGDKLLIIKGETAQREAQHIHTDFATPPTCEKGDLLGQEHAEQLEMLLAEFTVASMLDFNVTPSSRTAIKERAAAKRLIDGILAYIEQQHLDLRQEELLQQQNHLDQ